MNLKSGDLIAVDDKKAEAMVRTKDWDYISKSEFKNKPEYLQSGLTSWIPVKSSNINAIRYSPKTKTLFIKFGQPSANSCYKYENIEEPLFLGLLNAESKGKYFWRFIRPFFKEYPYRREY